MSKYSKLRQALTSSESYKISTENRAKLFESEEGRSSFEDYIFYTSYEGGEKDIIDRLVETEVFASESEAQKAMEIAKSFLLASLMYSTESHESDPELVQSLLRENIEKQSFDLKPLFLEALEVAAANEIFTLPNSRQLKVVKAKIPQHAAFFIVEYNASGRAEKLSYCDGNAPIGRDLETKQAYGEVIFKIDSAKASGIDVASFLRELSLDEIDFKDSSFHEAFPEMFAKRLSRILEVPQTVIEKKIPTKPQDRGNCSFKSSTLLIRKLISTIHPEIRFDSPTDLGYRTYKETFESIAKQNVDLLLEFVFDISNLTNPYHPKVLHLLQNGIFLQAVSKADLGLLTKIMPLVASLNLSNIQTQKERNALCAAISTGSKDKKSKALEWCYRNGIKIGAAKAAEVKKELREFGLPAQEIDAMIKDEDRAAIYEKEFEEFSKILFGKDATASIGYVFINLYNWVEKASISPEVAMRLFAQALENKNIVNESFIGNAWSQVFHFHEKILQDGSIKPLPEILVAFIDRFNINLEDPVSRKVGKAGEILIQLAQEAGNGDLARVISRKVASQKDYPPVCYPSHNNPAIDKSHVESTSNGIIMLGDSNVSLQSTLLNLNNYLSEEGLNLLEAEAVFYDVLQRSGMMEDPSVPRSATEVLGKRSVNPELAKQEILKFYKLIPRQCIGISTDFFDLLVEKFHIDLSAKTATNSSAAEIIMGSDSIKRYPAFADCLLRHVPSLEGSKAHNKYLGLAVAAPLPARTTMPARPTPPSLPRPSSALIPEMSAVVTAGAADEARPTIKKPAPPATPAPRGAAAKKEYSFPTRNIEIEDGGLRTKLIGEYEEMFNSDIDIPWAALLDNLNRNINLKTLNKQEAESIVSMVYYLKECAFEREHPEIIAYCQVNKDNPSFCAPLKKILQGKFKIGLIQDEVALTPVRSVIPRDASNKALRIVTNPLAGSNPLARS